MPGRDREFVSAAPPGAMAPRDDERGVAERLDDAKGGGGGAERATHRAGDADATMRKRGRDGEAKGNDAGGGGGRSGGDKGRGSGGGGGGKDLMDLFACPPSTDDYVCVGGLRLVRPYPFDFVCHVKKRLEGLNVVDMFAREFPARPRSYYEAAHRAGLLRVEPMPNARRYHHKASAKDKDGTGKSADVSTPRGEAVPAVAPLRPLRAGERVRHALHRHEPPALDIPVTVLAETPEMVAVHKPATVPVHPTGQYRKNTVVGILAAERPDLGRLLPVHRLDKNVSGLLLMVGRSTGRPRTSPVSQAEICASHSWSLAFLPPRTDALPPLFHRLSPRGMVCAHSPTHWREPPPRQTACASRFKGTRCARSTSPWSRRRT